MSRTAVLSLLLAVTGALGAARVAPGPVTLLQTPNGGIQPQAVVDARGTVHLLYFSGTPSGGDLFYVRRAAGAATFSEPLRVNSEPGTAMATGSVRGGHLSLGRDGWIHVAWDAAKAVEKDGAKYTPMYYTRLSPSARAFEPQRSIGHTVNLDGGTLAADARGHVYLVWHARGAVEGEAHRAVYVASSEDDGARFQPEKALVDEGGACGCCALTALADHDGRLNVLYRAATDGIHRDATWVVAAGSAVHREAVGPWEFNACPMTTFALAQAPDGLVGAWQTERQLFVAALDPKRPSHTPSRAIAGAGVRAHPSVAVNGKGERLIAWTDGTAWAKGGTVSWERQSADGVRIDGAEHVAPVPAWGLVSAIAVSDGSFVVVY